MEWLVVSLVASLGLTIALNIAIRLWPGAADRGVRGLTEWMERREGPDATGRPGDVRVVVPWKAMLIVSVVLTVALNVLLRLG